MPFRLAASRLALAGVVVLSLAACGRRGALEPPPDPAAPGRPRRSPPRGRCLRRSGRRAARNRRGRRSSGQSEPFILDPLPVSTADAPFRVPRRRSACRRASTSAPSRTRSARPSIAIPRPRWSGITGSSRTLSPDTDALVCYAMKANSNQAVLATLGRLGAGMDIVSGGELRRASRPACRASGSSSRGSPRPGTRWRTALDRRHPLLQRGIRA